MIEKKRLETLKKEVNKLKKTTELVITHKDLIKLSVKLYEKGYSGLDLIHLIENDDICKDIPLIQKYRFLVSFNSVKKEIRNEKLIILFILNFIFLIKDEDGQMIENIMTF
jgi:hypothetical protein